MGATKPFDLAQGRLATKFATKFATKKITRKALMLH
jgi:hypothetical protein